MPTTYRDMSSAVRLATCVGYSTITLRSGFLPTGASFKTIAKEKMALTDIIPTGYEEQSVWYTGSRATGFSDLITVQVLDAYGNTATDAKGKVRSFMFKRNGKNGAWTGEGYWHRTGETAAITKENDEFIDVGEGLWIQTSASAYSKSGCGPDQYKLMHSGEALMAAKMLDLRSGFLMMIPPLSADVKLTDIIPTGYEEQSVWYTGSRATGFSDLITVQVLDAYGNTATDAQGKVRSFMFKRAGKNGAWTGEGYWHRTGETAAITKENDETFKMGEGLWIQTSASAYSKSGCAPDAYKLRFPGIDDGADSAE